MKTQRLFWSDPGMFKFDARVLESTQTADGFEVVLDRTAFYPESGGQPADRGTLGGADIVDVIERGDLIVHRLQGSLAGLGSTVQGHVDMKRRADHSCQHTAQHIISAIAQKLWDAPTVGFHLGEQSCTVDLQVSDWNDEKKSNLETLSNQAVVADHPVTWDFAEQADLTQTRSKKDFKEGERIRIIKIADLDSCACCGTHMQQTGAIGMIKLGKTEKVRNSTRLEFLAGQRALKEFVALAQLTDELSSLTGSGKYELADFIKSTTRENKELRRANGAMGTRLAKFEATELRAKATPFARGVVICEDLSPKNPADIKTMATELTKDSGTVALLASTFEGRPALVFAQSDDLSLDVSNIFKEAIGFLGGRGGGRPSLSQGGGGDETKIADCLSNALKSVLNPPN